MSNKAAVLAKPAAILQRTVVGFLLGLVAGDEIGFHLRPPRGVLESDWTLRVVATSGVAFAFVALIAGGIAVSKAAKFVVVGGLIGLTGGVMVTRIYCKFARFVVNRPGVGLREIELGLFFDMVKTTGPLVALAGGCLGLAAYIKVHALPSDRSRYSFCWMHDVVLPVGIGGVAGVVTDLLDGLMISSAACEWSDISLESLKVSTVMGAYFGLFGRLLWLVLRYGEETRELTETWGKQIMLSCREAIRNTGMWGDSSSGRLR